LLLDLDFRLDPEKRTSVIVGPHCQSKIPDFIAGPFNRKLVFPFFFFFFSFFFVGLRVMCKRVPYPQNSGPETSLPDFGTLTYEGMNSDPERGITFIFLFFFLVFHSFFFSYSSH
jgi:hypothetical protein